MAKELSPEAKERLRKAHEAKQKGGGGTPPATQQTQTTGGAPAQQSTAAPVPVVNLTQEQFNEALEKAADKAVAKTKGSGEGSGSKKPGVEINQTDTPAVVDHGQRAATPDAGRSKPPDNKKRRWWSTWWGIGGVAVVSFFTCCFFPIGCIGIVGPMLYDYYASPPATFTPEVEIKPLDLSIEEPEKEENQ